MNAITFESFKSLARHATRFMLSFAHGGLMVAGVLVVTVVAYQYAAHGLDGLNPQMLLQAASGSEEAYAEDAPDEAVEAPGKLSAEYTRLVQYIAKRHKVSASALEEVVHAAISAGRAEHVDPVLILAVTSVESGFNPMAESVFGAQGLMQIIPRFHQDKIDSALGATALLQPAENIRVGARILREYMRLNGGLTPALQQYGGVSDASDNAYPSKVLAELERFRQIMKFGAVRTEVAENTAPAPAEVSAEAQANPS